MSDEPSFDDLVGDGLEAHAELVRPPAGVGHLLLHAQVDGATERELRDLAETLKAHARAAGVEHVYTTVRAP